MKEFCIKEELFCASCGQHTVSTDTDPAMDHYTQTVTKMRRRICQNKDCQKEITVNFELRGDSWKITGVTPVVRQRNRKPLPKYTPPNKPLDYVA